MGSGMMLYLGPILFLGGRMSAYRFLWCYLASFSFSYAWPDFDKDRGI